MKLSYFFCSIALYLFSLPFPRLSASAFAIFRYKSAVSNRRRLLIILLVPYSLVYHKKHAFYSTLFKFYHLNLFIAAHYFEVRSAQFHCLQPLLFTLHMIDFFRRL